MTRALHLPMALIVGLMLFGLADNARAVTLSSPVAIGDIFTGGHMGTYLYQTHGSSLLSTIPMTKVGGTTSDTESNLWLAHGDGGADPWQIEMIPYAQTTSSVKIDGSTLNAPAGAMDIRDIAFDSTGNLYALFRTTSDATVMKYAPNGSGGFNTGAVLGSFTGQSFSDYGAGRLTLSADGQFLVTGNWAAKKLHSMNTTSGAVVNQDPGPFTSGGAQIDPSRPDVITYSTNEGLSQTSFNPASGAIGSSSVAITTTSPYMCDSMTFVPELDRLYFTRRDSGNTLRYATGDQLEAAAAGSTLDAGVLTLVYTGSAASTNRDLTMVAPPHLDAPSQPGDMFVAGPNLRNVYQFRGTQTVGTLDFAANQAVGGVSTDTAGNVYLAGSAFGVYKVPLGQTQPQWLIQAEELTSGRTVRDCVAASDGTIYVGYMYGQIDQFTPDGDGYTRTTLGNSTISGGDYANMHLWLTGNEKYLLTSGRGDDDLVAISTADGTTTAWNAGTALAGEMAIDPITWDYIVFGTGSGSISDLRGISFDQETGTFGTTADILNTDTDDWVDGVTFDAWTGDLYMAVRNSRLRMVTYGEYLAARGGTAFDIDQLAIFHTGTGVSVARDMALASVPEPAGMLLMLLGSLSLLVTRRRRR